MGNKPLEKVYGRYRITLRKDDHVSGHPSPHVEIWKGNRKIGNFDMSSGKPLFKRELSTPSAIQEAISRYLQDPDVIKKVKEMIAESYFDLSKPAGNYGGIPRGFKVNISVEYTEKSLGKYKG